MNHDRYGLDGMPISCRGADFDPVTGLPFPKFPAAANGGVPYFRVILVVLMSAFVGFFAWQTHLLG